MKCATEKYAVHNLNGRIFPCPDADENFAGCGTSFKCDLHGASLLQSSDSMTSVSAEAADNDGNALSKGVPYWTGQRLDFKVQPVNSTGHQVSLSSETPKAIKTHVAGRLHLFLKRRRLRFAVSSLRDRKR